MEDKKVKKVLKARLKREFEKLTKEKRPMPNLYLLGYKTAISDCLWDLFGEVFPENKFMKKLGGSEK